MKLFLTNQLKDAPNQAHLISTIVVQNEVYAVYFHCFCLYVINLCDDFYFYKENILPFNCINHGLVPKYDKNLMKVPDTFIIWGFDILSKFKL